MVPMTASRMTDITDSLEYTLNHKIVKHVYIFYKDSALIHYIKGKQLNNSQKLKFVANINDTISPLFQYANEHLRKEVVLIMNADTYPGEGFEKLNFTHLRNYNLSYILSR